MPAGDAQTVTAGARKAPGWRWRVHATLTGETIRLLELVERLDELGCSAQVTAAAGSWEVDVRSTLPPTADLMRQVIGLIEREFPGTRTSSLLLEAAERRYHLLRPPPVQRAAVGPRRLTR